MHFHLAFQVLVPLVFISCFGRQKCRDVIHFTSLASVIRAVIIIIIIIIIIINNFLKKWLRMVSLVLKINEINDNNNEIIYLLFGLHALIFYFF